MIRELAVASFARVHDLEQPTDHDLCPHVQSESTAVVIELREQVADFGALVLGE